MLAMDVTRLVDTDFMRCVVLLLVLDCSHEPSSYCALVGVVTVLGNHDRIYRRLSDERGARSRRDPDIEDAECDRRPERHDIPFGARCHRSSLC